MAIRVVCEHCGASMKIKDELAGRKGHCPKCKAEFTIPSPASASQPGEELEGSSEYSLAMPPSAVAQGGVAGSLPDSPGDPESPLENLATADAPASRKSEKPKRKTDEFDPDDPFGSLDDDDQPRPVKKKSAPPPPEDDFPDNPFEEELEKPAARPAKTRKRAPAPEPEEEEWDAFEEQTSGTSKPKRALPGAKGSAANVADDFMRSFSGSGADDLGEEEAPAKKKRKLFGGGEDKGLSEGNFELSDLLMFGATKALPLLAGLILVSWGVYYTTASMVGGRLKLPPMGEVTGTVSMNGAPLPGAMVVFQPVGDMGEGLKYSNSVAISDDRGNYRLQYIGDVEGAMVGKHRVEIRARNAQSQEIVPKWYNARSVLTKEVAKGSNTINIELDGKNPPAGYTP